MNMPAVQYLPAFHVAQKLAMTANRYRVLTADDSQGGSQLMAFAHQKRLAFKEQVTFFAEEAMTTPVFGFRARKKVDLNAGYDIVDAAGAPLGFFRKDFGASLLKSTFHIEGPGYVGTGTERSTGMAILRRVVDVPVRFHFDFTDSTGAPLFSVDRKASIKDRYNVSVPDQRIDWRVAAAITVGLDALMSR